jgi:hypothetical protein
MLLLAFEFLGNLKLDVAKGFRRSKSGSAGNNFSLVPFSHAHCTGSALLRTRSQLTTCQHTLVTTLFLAPVTPRTESRFLDSSSLAKLGREYPRMSFEECLDDARACWLTSLEVGYDRLREVA